MAKLKNTVQPFINLPVMLLVASCSTAQKENTADGEVLPLPEPQMGGKVEATMQESVHMWCEQPRHLPEDAPNILIVMLDDAGFEHPSTFGGEIKTPTFSRLAEEGISYNHFHTTAMSSLTRAALITGRNHHRVGNGMVAEFANDWDGYTGVIPKSSATIARVLSCYGYATAAFGKDLNSPVANDYYDKVPFTFEGKLKKIHFTNIKGIAVGRINNEDKSCLHSRNVMGSWNRAKS